VISPIRPVESSTDHGAPGSRGRRQGSALCTAERVGEPLAADGRNSARDLQPIPAVRKNQGASTVVAPDGAKPPCRTAAWTGKRPRAAGTVKRAEVDSARTLATVAGDKARSALSLSVGTRSSELHGLFGIVARRSLQRAVPDATDESRMLGHPDAYH